MWGMSGAAIWCMSAAPAAADNMQMSAGAKLPANDYTRHTHHYKQIQELLHPDLREPSDANLRKHLNANLATEQLPKFRFTITIRISHY